jgi:DNA polymerase-3 subunit epsilon
MKIVAIDFETAAGRAAACSVGVFVFGDTKTISEHHLINPEINDDEWDSFAMTIHGISPSMVKKSANFKKVWERVEEISKDAVLLAHNASFDMSVIRYSLQRYKVTPIPITYLFSSKKSKKVWPELPTTRLEYLAEMLGIDFQHHNAQEDAKASAMVLVESLSKFYGDSDKEIDLEKFISELGLQFGKIESNLSYIPCGVLSSAKNGLGSVKGIHYVTDSTKIADESHPLFASHVAFTGTLSSMNRDEAFLRLKDLGAIPQAVVNGQTNFLIAGEQDLTKFKPGSKFSSKMQKAIDLSKSGQSIEIMGELDFIKLLEI